MSTTSPNSGVVYVLVNEAMPGFVKIGKTTADSFDQRIRELSSPTSVPLPFTPHYALAVKDEETAYKIENRLHTLFAEHRVNPKREFFRLSPEKAVQALLPIEDTGGGWPYLPQAVEEEEGGGVIRRERKRPPLCFSSIKIPMGTTLTFTRDPAVQCIVSGEREIDFEGGKTSVSAAAYKILSRRQGSDLTYNVSGPMYWMYEGETLDDRRLRLEAEGV